MIAERTVERLSLYRRLLEQIRADGIETVYSQQLAERVNVTSSQVRRDFMLIGYSGTPNYGYEVARLLESIEEFLDAPTPAIELRMLEAALIRRIGTACIDTSGGFFDALWLLHTRNPTRRFAVDRAALPLAAGVAEATAAARLPAETVLLGGAGEYELLFAVPSERLAAARAEFAAAGISVIGEIAEGPGEIVVRSPGREQRIGEPPPDPRAAASIREHAQAVVRTAREWFS